LENLTVLGIDPGLSITGFAILTKNGDSVELLKCGVIRTDASKKLTERLREINIDLSRIFENDRIDEVAIEKIFFNTNLKTVVSVSEARGVILFTIGKFNKPIYEYTPLEAKKAVLGNGRATKKEIQESIMNLLALKQLPQPDDSADAIAIALCHIYSLPYIRSVDDSKD